MNSRDKILNALRNQRNGAAASATEFPRSLQNTTKQFRTVLTNIGGIVVDVTSYSDINHYVVANFSASQRIVTTRTELSSHEVIVNFRGDPHLLETIDLAILPGHFGVAENGAVWITNELMGDRALPFICQHLALVIAKKNIVPTLHEAYDRINTGYAFGTFIAGPSKTADIEQSLVLGAHGPKSLTVFLMD